MNALARLVHSLVMSQDAPALDSRAALSVEEQATLAEVEALLHSTGSTVIGRQAEERPALDWAVSPSLPLEQARS
jgi:hypothetical protein